MTAPVDDLDILPAPPVPVTIADRRIEIGALRLRQWRPMVEALGEDAMKAIVSGKPLNMLTHEDAAKKAIVIATDEAVDEKWLADLYPSQLLRLFRVFVETNRDFFFQAVQPEMARLLLAFLPPAAPTPPAPSPGLSPADTATETSST